MSFLLGLTGGIGMGKSTTARMFEDAGCAVWDADAAVRRLYAEGGAAVDPLRNLFPDAISDNAVDRARLRQIIARSPEALSRIEAIVHPLVAADRATFIAGAQADIVVLDIPLLFETGGETAMDAVACVHVPAEVQRARVLARETMTSEEFEHILSRQMPNDTKCAKSDFVIETDTLPHAKEQVQRILQDIRDRPAHA